jgi:hypothetical protein
MGKIACGDFPDISCVAGRKRRDFRGLRIRLRRFSGHQLRCRPQKA